MTEIRTVICDLTRKIERRSSDKICEMLLLKFVKSQQSKSIIKMQKSIYVVKS